MYGTSKSSRWQEGLRCEGKRKRGDLGFRVYSISGGLLLVGEVGRNIVHLLSALAGQRSAARGRLGLLHHAQLGELLQDVTVDLTSAQGEVAGSAAESLGASKDLLQTTNTHVGSDIDAASDRGGSGVHPVGVIRGELLESGGLDDVNPLK